MATAPKMVLLFGAATQMNSAGGGGSAKSEETASTLSRIRASSYIQTLVKGRYSTCRMRDASNSITSPRRRDRLSLPVHLTTRRDRSVLVVASCDLCLEVPAVLGCVLLSCLSALSSLIERIRTGRGRGRKRRRTLGDLVDEFVVVEGVDVGVAGGHDTAGADVAEELVLGFAGGRAHSHQFMEGAVCEVDPIDGTCRGALR